MRQIFYVVFLFIFSSCNSNNNSSTTNLNNTDTILNLKTINAFDSLDIDTADNFITSNFPQPIQDKMHSTVDSLGAMVAVYYINDTSKDDKVIYQVIKTKLLDKSFVQIDSDYFLKRQFNTRKYVQIEHHKNKKVLFYYGMDLWSNGKKYKDVKMVLKDYQALN
ncbi:hypothetical protein [Ferruginibacter sp. SUN106]|uniref:hypothetical protein n=1 Tax=Ferruginibacter sp. SUN106 TaxID=2978348 RepID=UPI003D359D41